MNPVGFWRRIYYRLSEWWMTRTGEWQRIQAEFEAQQRPHTPIASQLLAWHSESADYPGCCAECGFAWPCRTRLLVDASAASAVGDGSPNP